MSLRSLYSSREARGAFWNALGAFQTDGKANAGTPVLLEKLRGVCVLGEKLIRGRVV